MLSLIRSMRSWILHSSFPAASSKTQGLADAQGLAVHLEDPLAAAVLDPEVVADGDQLLAHLVVLGRAAGAELLPVLLSLLPSAS